MSDNVTRCGRLYWCPTCDVPLLTIEGQEPRCDICGSRQDRPRYAASDMRPVFKPEHDFLAHQLSVGIPNDIFYNRRRIIYRGQSLLSFTLREGALVLRKENLANNRRHIDGLEDDYEDYLRKVVRANQSVLQILENEAGEFIRKTAQQYPNRDRFVSFSGGKDSTVVASLVQESLGNVSLFFADTTLEHDETVKYISDFAQSRGFRLESRSSRNDFFDMSRKLDPPSRIMRWCCSVFKAYPINLFWSSLDQYVLGFDGIRRAESRGRNGYPRIFQSEKFVRQITARPLLYWNSLAVWLYIFHKGLPFNPLYEKGYARIGCFLCPYNTDYDDLLNSYYQTPGWQQWLDFLQGYAREQYSNRPDDWINAWVHQGYWKQRKPRKRNVIAVSRDSNGDGALQYVFSAGIPASLPELLKPICSIKASTDDGVFRSCIESSTRLAGCIGSRLLTIVTPEDESREEFQRLVEKQIEKAVNCIGCGGCVGVCPHKAISLASTGIVIDNDICRHEDCRICVTTNLGSSGYSCIAMGHKALRRRVSPNATEIAPAIS